MTLPLAESFYSIQGEGCHAGKPAYFIRLGGCDVCCDFCDSKSTWNAKRFPQKSVNDIVNDVVNSGAYTAIITGGEPAIHDLTELTTALKDRGVSVFIETSGTRILMGDFDWICVSPKLNKLPLTETIVKANEIKVIIQHDEDFAFAEQCATLTGDDCLLFMQPEWSVHENITPQIVEYIKQNPLWNLSLQIHKYINIP